MSVEHVKFFHSFKDQTVIVCLLYVTSCATRWDSTTYEPELEYHNQHLLSTYYIPGTVLSAFPFSHLRLIRTPCFGYYPLFADEELGEAPLCRFI